MAFTELNRFAPEVLEGQLALVNGNQPNVLNMLFKPYSSDPEYKTLKTGDVVCFNSGKSLTPLVTKAVETGNPAVGIVLVNQKKDTFVEGDMVEVAIRGSIVYLKATEKAYRGSVFTLANADRSITVDVGIALDEAEIGEFVRVLIGGIL